MRSCAAAIEPGWLCKCTKLSLVPAGSDCTRRRRMRGKPPKRRLFRLLLAWPSACPNGQVEVPPPRLSAPPSEAIAILLAQRNPSSLGKMMFRFGEAVEGSGYPRSKDELHPGSTLWDEETSTWLSSRGSLSTAWPSQVRRDGRARRFADRGPRGRRPI